MGESAITSRRGCGPRVLHTRACKVQRNVVNVPCRAVSLSGHPVQSKYVHGTRSTVTCACRASELQFKLLLLHDGNSREVRLLRVPPSLAHREVGGNALDHTSIAIVGMRLTISFEPV